MTAERITVAEVRSSIRSDIRNQLTVTWFGRPLAHLMTPFFYNRGWTANGVTYLRMAIAAGGLVLLAIPGVVTGILGALIFYLCFVLDCVDGNLARLRKSVSYYGKFLDGISDFVFIWGAPAAAGIGIWLAGGDPIWMMAGMLASMASMAAQGIRSRLSFFREWMTGATGPLEEKIENDAKGPRRLQAIAAAIFVNGTFFAPILLVYPGDGRTLFVACNMAVMAAPEILWLAGTMWEARIILARGRRSIHSPDVAQQ